MEYFNNEGNKKVEIIADALKKAAELVHTANRARAKSEKAISAMRLTDKYAMWATLQEYYAEYRNFINSLSAFTGYTVYNVEKDFVEKITDEDIRKQLNILIGFIYAKEVFNTAAKQTYKECVKKILKKTKAFTDKELGYLS